MNLNDWKSTFRNFEEESLFNKIKADFCKFINDTDRNCKELWKLVEENWVINTGLHVLNAKTSVIMQHKLEHFKCS